MESEAELQAGGEATSACPGRCTLCGHGDQTLSLFCLDDLVPVCSVCGAEHTHTGHRVYPIEEAVHDCKGELERSVNILQNRASKSDLIKHTCESAFSHNQSQVQQTEDQIRAEFVKLHQFLREEEEDRITALREEEEKKRRKMKERCGKVEEMIQFISETIKEVEKEIEADDDDFQKSYENTVKRVWKCQKKPQKVFRTLIGVPEHVGNLRFKVWEKMMEIVPYFPVTLDENSASASLTVTPGLNQVQYEERHQSSCPSVPERFDPYACVVGSELISPGQLFSLYSWVVEVTQSTNWTLGVAKATVKRMELFEACPEAGFWTVSLRDGEYYAMTSPCERLELNGLKPGRIRVCLDLKAGRLTFTDQDSDTHLYTFLHSFTEPLLPYFESICPRGPITILPQRISVIKEKHKIPDEDEKEEDEEEVIENILNSNHGDSQ
ncbi:tripartite motif-containing protein 35-like [Astyanax mexicanus]|uniref:Tripartite motif-containing protein 35-like n=1 Tax=Astyanax mexicanus TaxID=7994 RepID=A0A8T2KYR7_ASTMX|nr:tripartite motif-containing protein 35-like [Astyanax mexicanus]